MGMTKEQVVGLNTALNEATLLDLDVDVADRTASLVLDVLALPEEGPAPEDSRVYIQLFPVGRMVVSLRRGVWDDSSAPVEPITVEQLRGVVRSFGGQPIYGEEFFDIPNENSFAQWSDRASLNLRLGADGLSHTLDLFQEGSHPDRHLDLRLWFDVLTIRDPTGAEVPLDQFIRARERWWERFWEEDPRTLGFGLHPIRGE